MLKWLKLSPDRNLKIGSYLVLAFVAAFMVWGAFQIQHINTHYSMSQFQPKDHPLYASDRLIKKTFNLTDQEPIIVNLELPADAKGSWFQSDRIEALKNATEAAIGIEGVQKITSITNVESAADVNGSLQVDRLLSLVPQKDWKKRVLGDPLLTPGLASKDGRVVTIMGDIGILTENQVKTITGEIKERIAPHIAPTGAQMTVSGVIPLQNQMTTMLTAELINFFGLAFLVSLITLLCYFRSFSTVILSLILVMIANITTMASLAVLGIPFSVLSSVLPVICSIEALSIGAHTLLLFGDNYRQARFMSEQPSKAQVVWYTFRGLLGTNFLVTTTTMLGFAALILSTVPLIKQFAISVAIGLMMSCIVISIALAPLMFLFPVPVARSWTGAKARWALWVIENRRLVVGTTAAGLLLLILNGFSLNWGVQLYDDLPTDGGMKSSADLIDNKLGGMIPLDVMITRKGEESPWNDPARMQKLASTLKKWRKDPVVGSAIGLPDLLNTGIHNMNSRQAIAETLFLYGFGGANNPTANFLSTDGNSTRVLFRLKDVPADLMGYTLAQVKKDFEARFPNSEVKLGGMASIVHPLNAELSSDLIYGLWHSLLLISIILVVIFRSFRLAIIAAVPNLLPPFALLATMTYLKTPIKPVVAIIFSIALGLAYNNTVFLLTRLQKLQKSFTSAKDAIRRTWYVEGNPCFFSSIAVLGGFAVFLASYFSPNRTFGAYMLWCIGVGLVGDLIVLPALLRMFPWFIFPGEDKRLNKMIPAVAGSKLTRNLIIFFAILLGTSPLATAADNVVRTPFLISMPSESFASLVNESIVQENLSGSVNERMSDISVTDPFQVNVRGINVNLRYKFRAPRNPANPTEWLVQHEKINATLRIDSVVAHQVMKGTTNGGDEYEFVLDGSCSNIVAELADGAASASARLRLGQRNGSPRLEVHDFKGYWAPGSWRITSMSCVAKPAGFDQLVAKAVLDQLQQINFNDFGKSLQASIDKKSTGKIDMILGNPAQAHQTVRLMAPAPRYDGRGDVTVKGEAFFYFKPGKGGCGANIRDFSQLPAPKAKDSALYVPFAAIKALFACVHSDGSLTFDSDSRKVKGFDDLMHNNTYKTFAWPDLHSFHEDALFLFKGVSSVPPAITREKATGNPNVFTAYLEQRMNIMMRAPKGCKHVNYMNVSAYYGGPVSVSVANRKVMMRMLDGGRIALGGRWDEEYLRNYDPKTKVSWERINRAANTDLGVEGWSFDIPSFGVSKNLHLAVTDGNLQGVNFRIGMSLVKPSAPKKPAAARPTFDRSCGTPR